MGVQLFIYAWHHMLRHVYTDCRFGLGAGAGAGTGKRMGYGTDGDSGIGNVPNSCRCLHLPAKVHQLVVNA